MSFVVMISDWLTWLVCRRFLARVARPLLLELGGCHFRLIQGFGFACWCSTTRTIARMRTTRQGWEMAQWLRACFKMVGTGYSPVPTDDSPTRTERRAQRDQAVFVACDRACRSTRRVTGRHRPVARHVFSVGSARASRAVFGAFTEHTGPVGGAPTDTQPRRLRSPR